MMTDEERLKASKNIKALAVQVNIYLLIIYKIDNHISLISSKLIHYI